MIKNKNMIKSSPQSAYQKTETLLYNYPKFENVLKSKLEEIETEKQKLRDITTKVDELTTIEELKNATIESLTV